MSVAQMFGAKTLELAAVGRVLQYLEIQSSKY